MQTWLAVTATGKLFADKKNTRFKYWLEGQERIGDNSRHFSLSLFRPGMGYAWTENLSLWAGYAWVRTGYPFTHQPFEEDRIWQQLLWIKKFQHFTLSSRSRTEQRFQENNPKTAYRVRQQLKISIPLKSWPDFSFVSSDEIFWHKNNFIGRNGRGFDQNRFFAGFSHKMTPAVTVEAGYMNQYVRRFGVPNFLANIVSASFSLNF